METEKFDELYEQAKRYYGSGHDEMYIVNQFAEQGIDNDTIDRVIDKIKKIKKSAKRNSGKKILIYGLTFTAFGIGLSWWSMNSDFEYGFFLYGLLIVGVMTSITGLARILGL